MSTNPIDIRSVSVLAAKEAGKILMNHFGNVAVEFKNEKSYIESIVTKADKESEDAIVALIKTHFPEHGIHGEEGTDHHMDADYVWYIDPLDGTSNFVRNIPLFGVSIGIVHNGQPICGVLYFPTLNLLLEAETGKGAFANGNRITVSKRPLEQALYYAGGKFKGEPQLNSKLASACGLVKILDASSYEFAQIAMGDAEIYFLGNVLHDVVAGVCIVREAGGIVVDSEGEPWQLKSKKILVATPTVCDEVVNLLNSKT